MQCMLSLYEKSMPNEISWKEKLTAGQKAGFDALEISIDESEEKLSRLDWSKQERKELLTLTREIGLYINTMCLSGHRKYPLGSSNPETEARGMKIMEQAIELAYDLGIRIIQLAGYDVYYESSNADTQARFGQNLVRAVHMAEKRGVILAFETMETPFMNTIEKAMRYVYAVNSPYLQVYPDIGNISNGTDDLTQYTCALDRQNAKLEPFFNPHHPAVLRAIKMTIEAGHRHGIWVGICGELGADTALTETFLRMGVDELSMNAKSILPVRKIIRSVDLSKPSEKA